VASRSKGVPLYSPAELRKLAKSDPDFARVATFGGIEALDPTAFELGSSRIATPDREQWAKINPARPRAGLSAPETVPAVRDLRTFRYADRVREKSAHPYRRLLSRDRYPRESQARADARVAATKTYLGQRASHAGQVIRRKERLAAMRGQIGGGIQWRIAITGRIERITRGTPGVAGSGVQHSPWRDLAPGAEVSPAEIQATYYATAREAVQASTSKLYRGKSEEAVLFPETVTLEYRKRPRPRKPRAKGKPRR